MSETTISVTQARASLPELLDRVAAGHEVTIMRHGKPTATLVSPDKLRSRRVDVVFGEAERIRVEVDEARQRSLPTSTGIDPDRAEDLVAEVHAGRRR